MNKAALELACGPDGRLCVLSLSFEPHEDDFFDCSIHIKLPHQLALELTGFLFYAKDFERLRASFETNGGVLDTPVIDSDCLVTITAEQRLEWIEWSIEWEGIYPAFQPFNPDGSSNSKIVIRGLRAHWTPSQL